MSPETFTESDGSPVQSTFWVSKNLEFLDTEIIENIMTLGLLEISSVVCLFKL